jgi:phage tail sheath gpL-like
MSTKIQSTSLARGRGVSVNNVSFGPSVENKLMKVLLFGTALAANTSGGTYTSLKRQRVYSADEVGKLAGYGSCVHRAAIAAFRGNQSKTEVAVILQAEAGGAAAAAGTFAVTHVITANGNLYLYVDGDRYEIPCTTADTATTIGDKIVAALAANPDCPVTGINTLGSVALTAKNKGTLGNDIDISCNQRAGEFYPAAFTATITPMATGSGDPTIAASLTALGVGDLANYEGDTHFVVCFDRLDATIMPALSVYNGTANEVEGCYLDTVGRPFTAWWGDTDPGTNALTAAAAIGTTYRETDKTNILITRPNSSVNPTMLAAGAAGANAAMAQYRPEESNGGKILSSVETGPLATLAAATGDWSTEYENRDTAVKSGISTTVNQNGVVKIDNLVTLYHPTTISAYSNCYRLVNNLWKVANMVKAWRDLLTSDAFDGITIVADVRKVTNQVSKQKVMDRDCLFSYVCSMVNEFEKRAWIYSAADTLDVMKSDLDAYIVLRAGGLGWDVIQPTILSGSSEILTVQIKVDANSANSAA